MTVDPSGSADETDPTRRPSARPLASESISYPALRSVWSVNVADFTGQQVAAFGAAVNAAEVGVSAIGPPSARSRHAPFGPELDRMRRVAESPGARTTIVRVFPSHPAGELPERYRGQVIDRMGLLAGRPRSRG